GSMVGSLGPGGGPAAWSPAYSPRWPAAKVHPGNKLGGLGLAGSQYGLGWGSGGLTAGTGGRPRASPGPAASAGRPGGRGRRGTPPRGGPRKPRGPARGAAAGPRPR